jgi:hypothetical protein
MPPSMRISGGYNSPQHHSIENGNRLGARPVVRQSKLYRHNESGNTMKNLLGHQDLAWNEEQQEGVFAGQSVYDARTGTYGGGALPQYGGAPHQSGGAPQQQQQRAPPPRQPQQPMFPQQQQPPPLPPQQQQQPPLPPQQQQPPPRAAQKRVCFGAPANDASGSDAGGGVFGAAGLLRPRRPAEVEYPLPGSVASCDACGSVVSRYYHCADCVEATGLFDLCVPCDLPSGSSNLGLHERARR